MLKNVRGGKKGIIQMDGYLFSFHFLDKVWQDPFYTSLALTIMDHGATSIINSGIEVFKIRVDVSVSPESIIKCSVIPDFYFIGEQGNWHMVAVVGEEYIT